MLWSGLQSFSLSGFLPFVSIISVRHLSDAHNIFVTPASSQV